MAKTDESNAPRRSWQHEKPLHRKPPLNDESIMEYAAGNVFIREGRLDLGNKMEGHEHNFDHVTYIAKGSAKVQKLDAEVKLAIAELQSKTTLKTSAMSANSAGDGETMHDEEGTPQASPGITALVQSVQDSMAILMQGQQSLAESITKASTVKRILKRDAAGNPYSEVLQ